MRQSDLHTDQKAAAFGPLDCRAPPAGGSERWTLIDIGRKRVHALAANQHLLLAATNQGLWNKQQEAQFQQLKDAPPGAQRFTTIALTNSEVLDGGVNDQDPPFSDVLYGGSFDGSAQKFAIKCLS